MNNLQSYKNEKVELLKDFAIYLSDHELLHMMELKTEIAVDNFVKQIMMDRF